MKQTRLCNTDTLCELADSGRVHEFNQQIDMEILERVDPEGIHICFFSMLHEHRAGTKCEPHLRTMWYLKMKGSYDPYQVLLDITMEDYDGLPIHETEEADAELV